MAPKKRSGSNPGSAASSPRSSPKAKAKGRPKGRAETPPPPVSRQNSESAQSQASRQDEGSVKRRVSTKAPASKARYNQGVLGMLGKVKDKYQSLLVRAPIVTKATTAAIIAAFGAGLEQRVFRGAAEFDWVSIARFAFANFILVGPVIHLWYVLLNRYITRTGFSGVFLRVLVDQLVFSPVFNCVLLSLLISLKAMDVQVVTKADLWETQKQSYMIWPAANFLIFWLVPLDFQLLAGNLFQLGWSIILAQKDFDVAASPGSMSGTATAAYGDWEL